MGVHSSGKVRKFSSIAGKTTSLIEENYMAIVPNHFKPLKFQRRPIIFVILCFGFNAFKPIMHSFHFTPVSKSSALVLSL